MELTSFHALWYLKDTPESEKEAEIHAKLLQKAS